MQCFEDFEFYSQHCLKIKHKELSSLQPFKLNDAQRIVLADRNRQLKERGYVRQIDLKGRQQGISTLIEGIGFHKVTHNSNVDAYILAHLADSTKTIFNMVKRFYDNCPQQMLPELTSDSSNELRFGNIDSGYGVGTAGSKSVGRGKNLNFFHGSEVGFWQNAEDIAAGVMNAVLSEGEGTEIYLESTANGMGNYFHTQWQMAVSGESEFEPIFIPWFLQPEYNTKTLPKDWQRTDEEEELAVNFGLRDTQLSWRRKKIVELSTSGISGQRVFKQEYPCYPNEAFQMTGENGLILPEDVIKARKMSNISAIGPVIMGIDPSFGGDRFAISVRQGRVHKTTEFKQGDDVKTLGQRVNFCMDLLNQWQPDYVYIDQGGGQDLVDRLRELTRFRITPIPFGGSPMKEDSYRNKRAEMYGELNQWLIKDAEPVKLVDSDQLQADLCATLCYLDSDRRLVLREKSYIKSKLGFSPDLSDSLALTFAEPVINFTHGRKLSKPIIRGNV